MQFSGTTNDVIRDDRGRTYRLRCESELCWTGISTGRTCSANLLLCGRKQIDGSASTAPVMVDRYGDTGPLRIYKSGGEFQTSFISSRWRAVWHDHTF